MMKISTGSSWFLGIAVACALTNITFAQDECADATPIAIGDNAFDNSSATNSTDPWDSTLCAGTFPGEMNQDIWLSFTSPSTGDFLFSTCLAGSFDTDLAIYSGDCENLTIIACNGDSTSGETGCQTYYSSLSVNLAGGDAYLVRIGGWDAAAFGAGNLHIEEYIAPDPGRCCIDFVCYDAMGSEDCSLNGGQYGGDNSTCDEAPCPDEPGDCTNDPNAPPNDCPENPILVYAGDMLSFDTTSANTTGPDEGGACNSAEGDTQIWSDLWYLITADTNGEVTATTCNMTELDTKVAAYDYDSWGGDPANLGDYLILCNEDCANDPFYASTLVLQCNAGDSFLIRVGGYLGGVGSGDVSFDVVNTFGACCLDDMCFEDVNQSECSAAGGIFQGPGSDCSGPCQGDPSVCDDPGSMTYPEDTGTMVDGGVACAGGGINAGNSWAVSLPASDVAAGDLALSCVSFGFSNAGSSCDASINIYIDNDGGAPSAPGQDLDLLTSVSFQLPTSAGGETLQVGFPEGSATIPAGSQVVVDLTVAASDGTTGGWVDYQNNGAWGLGGEVHIMSSACGLAVYTPMSAIGFPGELWTVALHGEFSDDPPPPDCPADIDGSGDVGFSDLLAVLSSWGNAGGPEDVDGDGSVGFSDLLAVLSSWGAC